MKPRCSRRRLPFSLRIFVVEFSRTGLEPTPTNVRLPWGAQPLQTSLPDSPSATPGPRPARPAPAQAPPPPLPSLHRLRPPLHSQSSSSSTITIILTNSSTFSSFRLIPTQTHPHEVKDITVTARTRTRAGTAFAPATPDRGRLDPTPLCLFFRLQINDRRTTSTHQGVAQSLVAELHLGAEIKGRGAARR